jgi:cell division septum initiation protein DivIVA
MKYHTPVSHLPKRKRQQRRDKLRQYAARFRQRQRSFSGGNATVNDSFSDGPCDSTVMVVKLPAITRARTKEIADVQVAASTSYYSRNRQVTNKRVKRGVNRLSKKVTALEDERTKLRRQLWSLRKRLQRSGEMKQVAQATTSTAEAGTQPCATPRSKTNSLMRSCGISPRKIKPIRRKLLTYFSVMDRVRETCIAERRRKSRLHPLTCISGKIAKKYRVLKEIRSDVGLTTYTSVPNTNKNIQRDITTRLENARNGIKRTVEEFLSREDNSTELPGKKDFTRLGHMKVQSRILTDYMTNLHLKFSAENPSVRMSRSAFCRLRPRHMKLACFNKRQTCLCTKHQNLSLKLVAINKIKRNSVPTNPEVFVEKTDVEIEDILTSTFENYGDEPIVFDEWQTVKVSFDGKVTNRVKLISVTNIGATDFIYSFRAEIKIFRVHLSRMKAQFHAIKNIKMNLQAAEVLCQMDFAENYVCSYAAEVQSAYFAKPSVTIHPCVIYFRNEDEELMHQSYVIVSDEKNHRASTVVSFLEHLVPKIKSLVPNLRCINYLSDSPTSQYRNKIILNLIAEHQMKFGTAATWIYTEAGHGKGPCDGIGGTVKRMADEAVRIHKVQIQDADDFYNWGTQSQSTIKYIYVPKSSTVETHEMITSRKFRAIPGIMNIHGAASVSFEDTFAVATRATSCVCANCRGGVDVPKCAGWQLHKLDPKPRQQVIPRQERNIFLSLRNI